MLENSRSFPKALLGSLGSVREGYLLGENSGSFLVGSMGMSYCSPWSVTWGSDRDARRALRQSVLL